MSETVEPVSGSRDVRKAGHKRWIIFVHGYNNSRLSAEKAWEKTKNYIEDKNGTKAKNVVLFFWPGDHFESNYLSALKYPSQIPVARKAAKRLVKFIVEHSQANGVPLEISFVAHSLGSLLVLEALKLLRSAHNVLVCDVLLMAAAVPAGLCDEKATKFYKDPVGFPAETMVLHSLDDSVLKYGFKIGQWLADELPENRQRAVGRNGGPSIGPGKRWTSGGDMDGFEHGDYWIDGPSLDEVARVVRGAPLFGNAAIKKRKIRLAKIKKRNIRTS